MYTDPKKVEAVGNWPIPQNIKQLRRFLGLAGYYRRFIRSYGMLSKPLTDLLRKDSFMWSEEAAAAFKNLKHALTTSPVLALPSPNKEFVVETDACGQGIGAILMPEGHLVAYISKALAQSTKLYLCMRRNC